MLQKKLLNKSPKKGQTIIEFAFVSILFVFMLVITFNAILAFCTQQYLSYAVFMTARAYQAADRDPQAQYNNAMRTLKAFVPALPANPGSGLSIPLQLGAFRKQLATITVVQLPTPQAFDYGPAGQFASQSIKLEFQVPFAQLPLGGNIRQQFGSIAMEASSFLGREVTKVECYRFFDQFIRKFTIEESSIEGNYSSFADSFAANMEDNGC